MFIMDINDKVAVQVSQITEIYVSKHTDNEWRLMIADTADNDIIFNRFDTESAAKAALRALVDTLNLEAKLREDKNDD